MLKQTKNIPTYTHATDKRVKIAAIALTSLLVILLTAAVTATLLRVTLTRQPSKTLTTTKELPAANITNDQLRVMRNHLFTYPQEWSYCQGILNKDLLQQWKYVSTTYKQDVPSVTDAVMADFQAAFKTEREYDHPGSWSASVTIDNQSLRVLGETPEVFIYEHTYTETRMLDYGKTKDVKNTPSCVGFLKHVNQAEKRFTKVDTQSVQYFLDKIVAANNGREDDPSSKRFVASTATDDGKAIVYQYYLDSPRHATCSKIEGGDAYMSRTVSFGSTCSDGFNYQESGGYVTLNTVRIDKQNGTYHTSPSGLPAPETEQQLRYAGIDIMQAF